jgi:hypothetical protein
MDLALSVSAASSEDAGQSRMTTWPRFTPAMRLQEIRRPSSNGRSARAVAPSVYEDRVPLVTVGNAYTGPRKTGTPGDSHDGT